MDNPLQVFWSNLDVTELLKDIRNPTEVSCGDRRRIVHLFHTVVYRPVPIHFNVPGVAHE